MKYRPIALNRAFTLTKTFFPVQSCGKCLLMIFLPLVDKNITWKTYVQMMNANYKANFLSENPDQLEASAKDSNPKEYLVHDICNLYFNADPDFISKYFSAYPYWPAGK